MNALGLACSILATGGIAYTLFAAWCLRRQRRPAPAVTTGLPALSILKPVRGNHPGLKEDLLSFIDHPYPAPVQIIVGLHHRDDPALPVLEVIRRERPQADIVIVVDDRRHGSNNKVSNLINMLPAARHDTLIVSDSDIRLAPGDLAAVAAALGQPGAGLVTCLYLGHPRRGFWSQLGALAVDHHFVPSVLTGLALGLANPTFGALIALRLGILAEAGGFEALKDVLADDHVLGARVRALGLKIAVSERLVFHAAAESSLSDLLRHELRWARTIRGVDPIGFAGSAITHPVPFALLALAFAGPAAATVGLLAAALAARAIMQACVPERAGRAPLAARYWLAPLRDVMSFLVFLASFCIAKVEWSGSLLRIGPEGTISDGKPSVKELPGASMEARMRGNRGAADGLNDLKRTRE